MFVFLVIGGYFVDYFVIKVFWRVVEGFTDEEKRKLLKFVISCFRFFFLGFKVYFFYVMCFENYFIIKKGGRMSNRVT